MGNTQSTQGTPKATPGASQTASVGRPDLTGVLFGATGLIAALIGLFSNLGQIISLQAGELVTTLSLGAVIVLGGSLLRPATVPRAWLAPALVLIVVLSGLSTFALSWDDDSPPAKSPSTPGTWVREGPPNQPLVVEMGPGDLLPQGSFYLNPPRPSPDPYTGDVTIECTTPGLKESVRNCAGDDVRIYAAEPVNKRSLIAVAAGDAFTDASVCEETAGTGVDYQAVYLEIAKNQTYCLRLRGDLRRMVAMRIVSWPTEQPRPIRVVMETTTWVR